MKLSKAETAYLNKWAKEMAAVVRSNRRYIKSLVKERRYLDAAEVEAWCEGYENGIAQAIQLIEELQDMR